MAVAPSWNGVVFTRASGGWAPERRVSWTARAAGLPPGLRPAPRLCYSGRDDCVVLSGGDSLEVFDAATGTTVASGGSAFVAERRNDFPAFCLDWVHASPAPVGGGLVLATTVVDLPGAANVAMADDTGVYPSGNRTSRCLQDAFSLAWNGRAPVEIPATFEVVLTEGAQACTSGAAATRASRNSPSASRTRYRRRSRSCSSPGDDPGGKRSGVGRQTCELRPHARRPITQAAHGGPAHRAVAVRAALRTRARAPRARRAPRVRRHAPRGGAPPPDVLGWGHVSGGVRALRRQRAATERRSYHNVQEDAPAVQRCKKYRTRSSALRVRPRTIRVVATASPRRVRGGSAS